MTRQGLTLCGITETGSGRLPPVPHATSPDGTRIAYQVHGEGQPLVLLAGRIPNARAELIDGARHA
jgi:hypothetical protein